MDRKISQAMLHSIKYPFAYNPFNKSQIDCLSGATLLGKKILSFEKIHPLCVSFLGGVWGMVWTLARLSPFLKSPTTGWLKILSLDVDFILLRFALSCEPLCCRFLLVLLSSSCHVK